MIISKEDQEKIQLLTSMIKKRMKGKGKPDVGAIINSAIEFVDNIGIPLSKTVWNNVILPLMDALILSKLGDTERSSLRSTLQMGDGHPYVKIKNGCICKNPRILQTMIKRNKINFKQYKTKKLRGGFAPAKFQGMVKSRKFTPKGGPSNFTKSRKFSPNGGPDNLGNKKFGPIGSKRKGKTNKWIRHVKRYMLNNNVTYREALSLSKATYVK